MRSRRISGGKIIARDGDALPKRFVDEQFAFSQLLTGAKELRPRWQRCVREATDAMHDAVGKAFVKNFVPAGTKERTLALVHNIRATLREDIQELDWMGTDTKRTLALGDTHPLGKFRVTGPFSNLPDFAQAYQCPATAPMVHHPRCKIW